MTGERKIELPDGWYVRRISEVAAVNPKVNKKEIPDDLLVSFVPMPAVGAEDGSIDVSDHRSFAEVKKGYTGFAEGDVLFAKITPCMENGKMAVVPPLANGYGFGSTEFHVLRPSDGVDSKYLYYYVSSKQFRGEAERHMSGAVGQRRVPTPYLKDCLIPIAPPEQQKRIVAEIEKQFSRLDEAVANLKRVKANLKRYKAAVLKAAVEGKLTEEWRKAHPDVEPASKLLDRILAERRAKWEEAELAKMEAKGKAPKNNKWKARFMEPVSPHVQAPDLLPEGWAWASVDQLGAAELNPITDGPFGSNLKTAHYTDEGPRVIRLQNIGNAEFLDEQAHISEEHYEKLRKHAVEGGDVIIAAMGRPAPRACLAPKTLGKAIVKADCIRFRAAREQADPTFLMYALNSHPTQQRTESVIHGVGRPRLNLGEIKSIGLPLPPIGEQLALSQEIDRQLSVLNELETEVEAQMARSEGLRQSILNGAFVGTLSPSIHDVSRVAV